MTTYKLRSTSMVYTPGIVKYMTKLPTAEALRLLSATFPQLNESARHNLIKGDYEVDIAAETVTVSG